MKTKKTTYLLTLSIAKNVKIKRYRNKNKETKHGPREVRRGKNIYLVPFFFSEFVMGRACSVLFSSASFVDIVFIIFQKLTCD